jgi:predicted nucleic acid-binding protein
MIAACDTGPLQYLILIGCDQVLPRMFTRILTARVVVEREMTHPRTPEPVRIWAASPPRWLEILEPSHTEEIPTLGRAGTRGDGDRAVISIALEYGADVLIMDDIKARKEAKKRGLKVLWMLNILDAAAEQGYIDDLAGVLDRLEADTPFYVGEKCRRAIDDMKRRADDSKRHGIKDDGDRESPCSQS